MWLTLGSLEFVHRDWFQDSDLAGDSKNQNRHWEEFCVSLGVEHSFPQVGCVRNKLQSHTVLLNLLKFLSLHAGLRVDGFPALDLWDLVVEVSHTSLNQLGARVNLYRDEQSEKRSNAKTKEHSQPGRSWVTNVDHVTRNGKLSHLCAFVETAEVQQWACPVPTESR